MQLSNSKNHHLWNQGTGKATTRSEAIRKKVFHPPQIQGLRKGKLRGKFPSSTFPPPSDPMSLKGAPLTTIWFNCRKKADFPNLCEKLA